MTKQINATGVNGTFLGHVNVSLNQKYSDDFYSDSLERIVPAGESFHLILGSYRNMTISRKVFEGMDLWKAVEEMEVHVKKGLQEIANEVIGNAIEIRLKKMGYDV